MSSRTWLSYQHQNRFHLTPLSYETLEFASGFTSEQCPEGVVAITANTLRFVTSSLRADVIFIFDLLRILALEKLGTVFNQASTPLQYTPRRFVLHPPSNHIILIETDHNSYTDDTKRRRRDEMAEVQTSLTKS